MLGILEQLMNKYKYKGILINIVTIGLRILFTIKFVAVLIITTKILMFTYLHTSSIECVLVPMCCTVLYCTLIQF